MQDRSKKSKVFFFCAFVNVLAMFFLGNPSLEELKFAEGQVSNVIIKKNEVGFFLEVKQEIGNKKIILNIDGVTSKAIESIRNFKGGEHIKVWYADDFLTKYDSVSPWKIESDGVVIISYEESKKKNNFYMYSFLAVALLFAIPGFWFLVKGK